MYFYLFLDIDNYENIYHKIEEEKIQPILFLAKFNIVAFFKMLNFLANNTTKIK